MSINEIKVKEIEHVLFHQLKNYWTDYNENVIRQRISSAIHKMQDNYSMASSRRLWHNGEAILSPYHSVTWMIFLYRLSRELAVSGELHEADLIYYLNKILHGNDWYHQAQLPPHFLAEHPLGSVLGRANYGDYLFVYQGTTVGGNRKGENIYYPVLGNNVVLYANSTVLGNSHIGNNVIVSANSYIINENIPDNCIVFGQSPNLTIKLKTEEEIKEMTIGFWRW